MKMTDLHDPFEGYSGLSRFPLTFASLPVPNSDDLHSIHNFLMSLPVQSPDKLIGQAKAILDNTTQVPDFGMISDAISEEKNEVIGDIAVPHPKGQRPGIDRERASFHLLPSVSQPTVNLEPTAVNCNMNPVEYFLAFDRRQKAIKEIAKHRGGTFTGSDQYNVFKVPQAERPGLQGRSKKPKYEHMYSEIPSQKTCEGDILSSCGLRQETVQSDVASQQTEPDNVESQQLESTNVALQQIKSAIVATEELEMTGSTAKGKKTASQIFDDLLADGYGDLEGDRAENLLLEHLQIKSPHKKLNLPDMQDLLKIDFEVPRVNLPKSRNVSSNILLEMSRNRTPAKLKNMETSIPNFGSPTPPKSPLALLSLSEKHIFQSNPSRDTFSAIGIDQSPARRVSPVENIIKCSDPIGSKMALCIPGKLKSTTKEDDVPVDGRSSIELAIEGSTSCFEKDVNGRLSSLGSGSEMDNRESGPELEGNNVGIGNESINENLSQADANADHRKDGLGDLEDIVEDAMQDAEAFAEPNRNTDYSPMETSQSNQNGLDPAIVEDQLMDESTDNVNSASFQTQDTSLELSQATSSTLQTEKMKENSVRSTNELEKGKSRPREERRKSIWQRHTDPAILEDQPVDESAENVNSASFQTQDTSLEQTQATISTLQTEKMKKTSMQSTNKLRKGKSGSRKVRESSRRQSLAGCGMSWEAGVRRSTRIRSRPLEFWRGERFLYARIHQGLPSVIGIKYESPENATFKVKSFVSEKHKHLFDQAAL